MQTTAETTPDSPTGVRAITLAGWAMCILFVCAGLIWDRTTGAAIQVRPVRLVFSLYMVAFVVAMFAMRILLRSARPNRMVPIIILFGLSFRAIQLFSTPFLEIDIYRYMWDGTVVSTGMSPYEWSPAQARAADPVVLESQQEIVALASSTEPIKRIVGKVHFAEYTTIYPPVSQAIFGATMWLVQDSASVTTHLTAMKVTLVGFDVGTMFLLLACLRVVGRNPVWVAAYAWNPLLVKEIANSGHLDSIAVFFMMAAVLIVAKELKRGGSFHWRSALLAGVVLSLAAASKLFPIVLTPLFFMWIWRKGRSSAVVFVVTTGVTTALLLTPMLVSGKGESRNGLSSFLSRWRMNALVYDVVYENARIHDDRLEPWYSVIPVSTRDSLKSIARQVPGSLPEETKVARTFTLVLFAVIYLWILLRIGCQSDHASISMFPLSAFYVLVAFLFLQPTVNPWYWVWVVPFVCFTRNLGWHMVGAWLLIYYLRFWFKHSGMVISLGGTRYEDVACFDHLVMWGEYALIVLGIVAFKFFDKNVSEPRSVIP